MLRNYIDIANDSKTINLVNSADENLKKLGLKPLYATIYPRYINQHGNIFYGGFTHYQCNLSYDVERMLSIMYFNNYGLSLLPDYEENLDSFYLEMNNLLKPYSNPNSLTGYDIRRWINTNANIFKILDYPLNLDGVYNIDTMNIINNILETKLEIYTSLYNLAKEANDMKKLVHDLLVEFNVYKDFDNIVYSNPFSEEAINAKTEMTHWQSMFREASPDILVQLIGLDKIETRLRKTITTTKANIYEEFYNLILLGYDIVQLPKLICYNEQLRWIKAREFMTTGIDRECEQELKLIKKNVPYDQWYKFLKD